MAETECDIRFGPYLIDIINGYCSIRREDGAPVEPTFFEMQYIKDTVFGVDAIGIEIFPATGKAFNFTEVTSEPPKRYLWRMGIDAIDETVGAFTSYTGDEEAELQREEDAKKHASDDVVCMSTYYKRNKLGNK